jgi:DNA-binding PadR family transcriptional regulator
MSLRYALLALLAEGEAHGYQLFKRFVARLGPLWHPNVGQVYQLLRDLEQRRLIVLQPDTGDGRGRRRFRTTPRGERALRVWLGRRPGWPAPIRDEIFVRLLASERHGADAIRAQIDRQEEEYLRHLALVREQAISGADGSMTRRLAHEAALIHAEASLRWLARCRELLRDPSRLAS